MTSGKFSKGIFNAVASILFLVLSVGCSPKLTALRGTEFTGALPNTQLTGHHVLDFSWRAENPLGSRRGLGRIRVAAPDSLRFDLEMQGGQISGFAILIGPGPVRSALDASTLDMLPSAELVWAALGRLAVPASTDTVKRVLEGAVIADIGSDPKWRATFDGQRLASVEKAERGRIVERVTRGLDGTVTYKRGKNTLTLTGVKDSVASPFPPVIWRN